MIRRLFALATLLFTVNVSAAEALRLCASQASHVVASTDLAQSHQHHEGHHPAPADRERRDSPGTPTACCDAMLSCGISVAFDGVKDRAPAVRAVVAITRAADRVPAFDERSPEPPPPKELA